jgi:hypothetical protein
MGERKICESCGRDDCPKLENLPHEGEHPTISWADFMCIEGCKACDAMIDCMNAGEVDWKYRALKAEAYIHELEQVMTEFIVVVDDLIQFKRTPKRELDRSYKGAFSNASVSVINALEEWIFKFRLAMTRK